MVRKKILIVENEAIVAQELKYLLEDAGHTVIAAGPSGEAAIARATVENPDLMLIDIGLKGKMDGIEAAAQIISKLKIPVIHISAYADGPTRKRLEESGSFGLIQKPFEDGAVLAMIDSALAGKNGKKVNPIYNEKIGG